MSDRSNAAYLPLPLADALRRWAPPEVSDSEMWELQRIGERIYAQGYEAGSWAGYHEGRDAVARPNGNDVNRLREALAETPKEIN